MIQLTNVVIMSQFHVVGIHSLGHSIIESIVQFDFDVPMVLKTMLPKLQLMTLEPLVVADVAAGHAAAAAENSEPSFATVIVVDVVPSATALRTTYVRFFPLKK